MNVYNRSLTPCNTASLSGVTEILVKSRSELGEFWFYEETSMTQAGKIIGNTMLAGSWYRIVASREFTNFNQVQEDSVSRLYNQTLDLRFNKIDIFKRDVIEEMKVVNDLVVIFKDKNQQYWLMGETLGCKLNTWNWSTGNSTGNNETTLQFTAVERYPIRSVDITLADVQLLAICDLPWASVCALAWNDICTNYSWN